MHVRSRVRKRADLSELTLVRVHARAHASECARARAGAMSYASACECALARVLCSGGLPSRCLACAAHARTT
eukprot:7757476-Alexandrium_andersonii.AAC.1